MLDGWLFMGGFVAGFIVCYKMQQPKERTNKRGKPFKEKSKWELLDNIRK